MLQRDGVVYSYRLTILYSYHLTMWFGYVVYMYLRTRVVSDCLLCTRLLPSALSFFPQHCLYFGHPAYRLFNYSSWHMSIPLLGLHFSRPKHLSDACRVYIVPAQGCRLLPVTWRWRVAWYFTAMTNAACHVIHHFMSMTGSRWFFFLSILLR